MSHATSPRSRHRPLLILDFDGTVCIGDGPVWAYADAALSRVHDEGVVADVRRRLAAFLRGDAGAPHYQDGYAAVAELTAGSLDAAARQDAYRDSRTALAAGLESDVAAPDGLHEFLADVGRAAARVLVTNAPPDGVKETLSTLGLTDVIDSVHANSGKPGGFPALLSTLAGDRDPAMVMSVGDVYANDIAPAYAFGAATAYIDRWNHRTGPAHLRAESLPPLYPAIADWAADPFNFPPSTTRATRATNATSSPSHTHNQGIPS